MIPRILSGLLVVLVSSPLLLNAETKTIIPDRYYDTFSQAHPPVGRIKVGDKVITKLLDSRGHDENGKLVIYADNVLTGPFFVEGAEPGDTLIVHLDKVRLNRNWGWNGVRVGLSALSPGMVAGIYSNECCEEWLQPGRRNALKWDIDLERQTVKPSRPLGDKVNMEFPAPSRAGLQKPASSAPTALESPAYWRRETRRPAPRRVRPTAPTAAAASARLGSSAALGASAMR